MLKSQFQKQAYTMFENPTAVPQTRDMYIAKAYSSWISVRTFHSDLSAVRALALQVNRHVPRLRDEMALHFFNTRQFEKTFVIVELMPRNDQVAYISTLLNTRKSQQDWNFILDFIETPAPSIYKNLQKSLWVELAREKHIDLDDLIRSRFKEAFLRTNFECDTNKPEIKALSKKIFEEERVLTDFETMFMRIKESVWANFDSIWISHACTCRSDDLETIQKLIEWIIDMTIPDADEAFSKTIESEFSCRFTGSLTAQQATRLYEEIRDRCDAEIMSVDLANETSLETDSATGS